MVIPILPTLSASSLQNNQTTNLTATPLYDNITTPQPIPAQMEFTWDQTQVAFVIEKGKPLFMGWVNQQNVPIYTELSVTGPGIGKWLYQQSFKG